MKIEIKDVNRFIEMNRVPYERGMDFPKSSYHFQKRVLELIRNRQYEELLTDTHFWIWYTLFWPRGA